MKKKALFILFAGILLINTSLVKAQVNLDTLSRKLSYIDSTRLCYGYYTTNDGQKIPATFVIADNDNFKDTRWVEELQYYIKALQKDSSVKLLRPGKIKGYKIENWGKINLQATKIPPYQDTTTSNNITKKTAEFESVNFHADYEHVTGYSEMSNQHYATFSSNGTYFFYIKDEGKYINRYYWWEKDSPERGHRFHPYVSELLFNKDNKRLTGQKFNGKQEQFCPDDSLLSNLIKKRYLSSENDLNIIGQEYTYWRWKKDCLNIPDSINSIVFNHYLNKQTDTSYALKAVIDANKMYRHRGILLTSFLLTTALTPFSLIPYWRYEIKKKPKFPTPVYSNHTLLTSSDYCTTYPKVSIDTKAKMLDYGGVFGLFGLVTAMLILSHK